MSAVSPTVSAAPSATESAAGCVARATAYVDRAVSFLDRGLAEPYRISAFTNARSKLLYLSDADLWSRVHTNTLTELPGVGASIASLVHDAVLGLESPYLAKLDAETRVVSTAEGAVIRKALQGDLHVHTDWSDGGASISEMARAAAALGHSYIAVTDHSGRLTVAKGLDRSRLRRQLDEHAELRANIAEEFGIRLVTGVEVDINEDGSLDGDNDTLAELDIVVASVHVKMGMPKDVLTTRILQAVVNPNVDVLGHCTGRKVTGKGRAEMNADWDLVFAACARYGTAVELNCRPERLDPPRRLLARASEIGCVFAIDSDAHAPGQLEWQPLGCNRAAEVGIEPDRIINTWDWKRLAEWTNDHARL